MVICHSDILMSLGSDGRRCISFVAVLPVVVSRSNEMNVPKIYSL